MAQEINFYQGDTFLATGMYRDANGVAVDLIAGGIAVESYIRDRNNLKITLPVVISGATGAYSIAAPTDLWPLGRVLWFVRYVQAGVKKSTEPVVINVEVA